MECGNRKARYLSEISSVRELREARRELELREFFARERLVADVEDALTLENLLSIVAPPGSVVDRVIGGVGTGIAAVQGIFGALGAFIGGRRASVGSSGGHTVRHRKPAGGGKTMSRSAAGKSKATHSVAPRKRSGELEVEVELD